MTVPRDGDPVRPVPRRPSGRIVSSVAAVTPTLLGRHVATIHPHRARTAVVAALSASLASGLAAVAATLPLVAAVAVGWFALACTVVAVGQVVALTGSHRIDVYEFGSIHHDRRGPRLVLG